VGERKAPGGETGSFGCNRLSANKLRTVGPKDFLFRKPCYSENLGHPEGLGHSEGLGHPFLKIAVRWSITARIAGALAPMREYGFSRGKNQRDYASA
jgi:hypothetical protein